MTNCHDILPDIAPDISVVIPTYNRRDILLLTLPTVLEQDLAPERREVIVVVDGSTDGTIDALKHEAFAQVRVIEQSNAGISAARNAGLRAARGRLVLFLDDDMMCEASLLRRHVEAHEEEDRASTEDRVIVMGEIELSPQSTPGMLTEWRHDREHRWLEKARAAPGVEWWQSLRFAHASAPRRLLIDAGGFDERFRFADEDIEFGVRLARAGARLRFVRGLVVRHVYRKSMREFINFDVRWYGKSQLLFCRTYPENRRRAPLGNLQSGSSLKARVRELLTRSSATDYLLQIPFGIASALSNIPTMRRAAMNLLDHRQSIGTYRGAMEAAGSWNKLREEVGMRLPVLLYHHVGPAHDGAYPLLTVSPDNFEQQLRWLNRRGYTTIRPADWIAWCRHGRALPSKPVLITFDDGYQDLAQYAFPALKRHGMTATVFLVASCIGKTNQWDTGTWSLLPLLSEAQIREWGAQGIEFGSHTSNHPHLTSLSPRQLEAELVDSSKELGHLLGSAPETLAYPFGSHNEDVSDSAGRTFELSFTTDAGINCLATDRSRMYRLEVLPYDNLASFATLLALGYRPMKELRQRIAIRSRVRAAARRILRLDAA
ncbi:MAG: polysaccharide deacetylase family protein [Candidatus Binatus sp.]|uniref:glycosyltransferase n=1 Tax=Candidatus Binatus sp. TaxID=2811406 RepID=UPI002726F8AE|nr:polysaccharide deacetylase family protein [Candidatus Binatus sp.]MDO8431274.1 polysaccharide deacetylase family protein [Candidatus Binatus sp.]